MAGDWLKMRTDLADDPAVIAIADGMDIREEFVVGLLHCFWAWVDKHCADGVIRGISVDSIERRLRLDGLLRAMEDAGWLIIDEENGVPVIEIPNFDRHLGENAKARAHAAERQRKSRHSTVTKNCDTSVTGVTKICDKSVTREEKRREEKNKTEDMSHPVGCDESVEQAKEAFEERWKRYPARKGRRVGKPQASKQFKRQRLDRDDKLLNDFDAALENYRQHCESSGQHPRDMERFLRDGAWKEWIEPPESLPARASPSDSLDDILAAIDTGVE